MYKYDDYHILEFERIYNRCTEWIYLCEFRHKCPNLIITACTKHISRCICKLAIQNSMETRQRIIK